MKWNKFKHYIGENINTPKGIYKLVGVHLIQKGLTPECICLLFDNNYETIVADDNEHQFNPVKSNSIINQLVECVKDILIEDRNQIENSVLYETYMNWVIVNAISNTTNLIGDYVKYTSKEKIEEFEKDAYINLGTALTSTYLNIGYYCYDFENYDRIKKWGVEALQFFKEYVENDMELYGINFKESVMQRRLLYGEKDFKLELGKKIYNWRKKSK
jgi:hypothetical protein